jgi:hypothetical protein
MKKQKTTKGEKNEKEIYCGFDSVRGIFHDAVFFYRVLKRQGKYQKRNETRKGV